MPSSISAWKRFTTGSIWWICPPLTAFTKTVNGTHPNKKGMTTFAQAWYEAMKDSI